MDHTPSGGATAAVLQTMTLLSTLSTAVEVGHALRERRAGRDPSAQEDEGVVRPFLWTSAGELERLLMQLQASLTHRRHHEEGTHAALVRRFDDLMLLHRLGVLLGVVHQRLLSLYPEVGEALVEEARALHGTCEAVSEGASSRFAERAGRLVAQGLTFAAWMRQELAYGRS